MQLIILLTSLWCVCCDAAPTSTTKIFPNDPDVSPGQPSWTEWQITTQLVNQSVLSKECKPDTKDVIKPIEYYYNELDVSNCGEPNHGIPCISEMHIPSEASYVPYFTWTTFVNTGTFQKPVWELDLWFNYNKTSTYSVGQTVCDGKPHTFNLNPCVFTPKIQKYNFKVNYTTTCSRDSSTGYLNLDIVQSTTSSDTTREFTLISFENWRPYTSIVEPTSDMVYDSVVTGHPPKNTPCKSC
jgi:hypothetical protein